MDVAAAGPVSACMLRESRKEQVSSFCTHTDLHARTLSHCEVDLQKGARSARFLAAMTLAVLALAAVAILMPYKADLCVKAMPGTKHAASPQAVGRRSTPRPCTHAHMHMWLQHEYLKCHTHTCECCYVCLYVCLCAVHWCVNAFVHVHDTSLVLLLLSRLRKKL